MLKRIVFFNAHAGLIGKVVSEFRDSSFLNIFCSFPSQFPYETRPKDVFFCNLCDVFFPVQRLNDLMLGHCSKAVSSGVFLLGALRGSLNELLTLGVLCFSTDLM